ncbi:MAG: thymidine kinase [Deltaproteobacteria bacterium RIFOXYA12_FULL_61_11]|nr:MAG: thymidine kinase [Deltaproteobacteria bacterium RIFOXYA12_FULL_61_11]
MISASKGWIEVICGSMFSGKTEELIRRLRRALIARQRVMIFKPRVDTRYDKECLVSHSEARIPSTMVELPAQILELSREAQVVGIDEAQFFDQSLVEVCNTLALQGKRVIVCGLDQDYLGRPFEPIPQLICTAEYVTKLLAICVKCGAPACKNQRIVDTRERILVGESNLYEARCRRCYEQPS